ncbi:16S rRNA (guanine(527)-N(7))-methyltransferase RsmG [Rugosimonospora africana]|uniref:16S rRNA (guanine(527)-N(7))-methyltransferase RsmG n=1 Tax=Rugosimonospora africana TaxID=556532 RepID=UPI003570AA72
MPESPSPLPESLSPAARVLFGDRLPLARQYADLLATDGVIRGLIGPREAPRIWDRHLLNCAAMAELVQAGAAVVDVGSGAGLPGVVLAIARPDLTVVLVEPLARRTLFLTEAVARLDLQERVSVVRGRAEELVRGPLAGQVSPGDVVTARAVAPMDRLAAWCLPLASVGGRLLALKGASAADEVETHRDAIGRLGGGTPVIRECGAGLLEQPATVVEVVREREVETSRRGTRAPAGRAERPRARRGGSTRSRW